MDAVRQSAQWRGLTLAVLLTVATACRNPTECCLVDSSAEVIVVGMVHDPGDAPVSNVVVFALEHVDVDCTEGVAALASVPDTAVTDSLGAFALRLITFLGPGEHCVDLVLRAGDGVVADTVRDLRLGFRHVSMPPDTLHVSFPFAG